MYYLEATKNVDALAKRDFKEQKKLTRKANRANFLNKHQKGIRAGAGITAAVGGVTAVSAAVAAKKYKNALKKAKNTQDPRVKRILMAKADRYKKIAIAGGALGTAALGAGVAGAALGTQKRTQKLYDNAIKKSEKINKKIAGHKKSNDVYAQAYDKLNESLFLEGYYDALEEYGYFDEDYDEDYDFD